MKNISYNFEGSDNFAGSQIALGICKELRKLFQWNNLMYCKSGMLTNNNYNEPTYFLFTLAYMFGTAHSHNKYYNYRRSLPVSGCHKAILCKRSRVLLLGHPHDWSGFTRQKQQNDCP